MTQSPEINGSDSHDEIILEGNNNLRRASKPNVKDSVSDKILSKKDRDFVHITHVANAPPVTDSKPQPLDETLLPCILFEPAVEKGNISPSGLHFIASHQYRPSSPTHLDTLLNPLWTFLTELLPTWVAPNMVTTLGGLHCGIAYGILWWYAPDFDKSPPDWVVALSAYSTVAYYTLDCMDGKQARRIGASSPLGQLL